MLQKTPAEQENGLSSIIRTFDPDVPGYVFWLVMLMLLSFDQVVLRVRSPVPVKLPTGGVRRGIPRALVRESAARSARSSQNEYNLSFAIDTSG